MLGDITYETQIDLNAAPGSPWASRHRIRRPTGLHGAVWQPGSPPKEDL